MPDRGRSFRVVTAKRGLKPCRSLRILFIGADLTALKAAFGEDERSGLEGYAIALCGIKASAGRDLATYMVHGLHIPGKGDLIEHSSVSVTPSADFMEAVLARASERQSAVLEIHTHPGSDAPSFSAVDFEHGLENGRFLRSCGTRFGMMVIGAAGFAVMEYHAESDSLRYPASATLCIMSRAGVVEVAGRSKATGGPTVPAAVDRQVRIWGEECQRKISGASAGIVGLGGTGAALLQMLARVGVKQFVLCDPDAIEPSNLSRLPYAFEGDEGRKKVRAAARYVRKLAKDARVETISGHISDAGPSFRNCDVLFGCADNDGARLSLNWIALKYYLPYIDTGAEIFVEGGSVLDMGGQVRVVVPGVTGCLECAGVIDHAEAAAAMLPAEEAAMRDGAGYVRGNSLTPAPAVITLNTIVASMAAQEFVNMMARPVQDDPHNYFIYDAMKPGIERLTLERSPSCPMCGPGGVLGTGDLPRGARSRARARALAGPGAKSL